MASMTVQESEVSPDARMRVMLVDDHLDSVVSIGRLLLVLGYNVRAALDGVQALACANEFRPHVALIDLSLPELDGYTVASRLRANELTRHTRLIALTGWSTSDSKWRSRQAGFELHLVKPVSVDALTSALNAGASPAAAPWPALGERPDVTTSGTRRDGPR